ncbi:GTP cyclohydrolase I [Candidatus Omnitrophota bacterium]
MRKLKSRGVMVIIEVEHLCMFMRRAFKENQKTRAETLSLIKG